jgi:hypothetical protein
LTIDADRAARLRARLGRPPAEASGNLSPPVNHEQPAQAAKPAPEPRHEPRHEPAQEIVPREGRGETKAVRRTRRDIRTISATGRLVQFSSRITLELDSRIGDIIERRQAEINDARRGPKYKYGICNFLEEAAFLFENIPTAED